MKNRKFAAALSAIALSLGLVAASDAELVSRLGGLAVYDTDRDVTWLANANAAVGSAFDDGSSNTDGRMTWSNANAWAASLTVGGVTDWRLPTTLQPDASCSDQGAVGSFGFNCNGSEMGHLNNVEGVSLATPGLFSDIQALNYWTSTEVASNLDQAWRYNLFNGSQDINNKNVNLFALAVRSGDVGAVADTDEDGVSDNLDNCIDVANADQRDTDGDAIGNLCDPDVAAPNDCAVNFADLNLYKNNFFQAGDLDTDNNGDGQTNFADLNILKSFFFGPPGPSAIGCN